MKTHLIDEGTINPSSHFKILLYDPEFILHSFYAVILTTCIKAKLLQNENVTFFNKYRYLYIAVTKVIIIRISFSCE